MKHIRDTNNNHKHLSRQGRINLEIFHAIEALGERLKSTEVIKNEIEVRLEDLESGAEIDQQTGKYYLPLVIDPAQLPENFNNGGTSSSKAIVLSSFVSFFVAVVALTITLMQQPDIGFWGNKNQSQTASIDGGKIAYNWQSVDEIKRQKEQERLMNLLLERLYNNEQMLAELQQRQTYVENQYAKILLSDIAKVGVADASKQGVGTEDKVANNSNIKDKNIKETKLAKAEDTNKARDTASQHILEKAKAKTENNHKEEVVATASDVATTDNAKSEKVKNTKVADNNNDKKPVKTAQVNKIDKVAHKSSSKGKITLTQLDKVKPDPNLPNDLKTLEKKAIAGDPAAQHDLGALYASGQVMPVNYKKAAYWFLKAAENGVANAHYNLGVMYHQGMGLKRNVKKALYWYRQAAAMGHPEALYNLGIAYVEGIGTPVDTKRGIGYLKRAANAGIAQAAYNLGVLYEGHFSDDPKSREKAIKWYEYAGKMGSEEAIRSAQRLKGTNPMLLASNNDEKEQVLDIPEDLNNIETAAGYELPPVAMMEEGSADEDIFDTVKYPVQLVSRIQRVLIDMNLLPHKKPTGKLDLKTADAIRSFQKSHGLKVNGKPSQNLLDMMLSSKK